jgi:hydroxyacylglutathione hydrolase
VVRNINKACFTGDTLFVAGCGLFFEGTPACMVKNMKICRGLTPTMPIFPGHDFAVYNLRFALKMDPENKETPKRLIKALKANEEGRNFVPTTIKNELRTNIYLRCLDDDMQKITKTDNPVACMDFLR